jgi:hypothetical protein
VTDTTRITITKVEYHEEEGYFTANASINGQTRTFHDRFGSWLTDRKRTDDWPPNVLHKEAPRPVARKLEDHVRSERRRLKGLHEQLRSPSRT